MKIFLPCLRLTRARAFSLPETTIAVAIAALGIVSIMGLMPQGLESARKTGNMASESRIMQEIVGELESTDWVQVDAQNNTTRQYDDQGVLISSGASTGQLTSYVAKVNLVNSGVPGGVSSSNNEPFMRRLTVYIATTSNPNYGFPPSDAAHYKTISFILAKTQ